MTDTAPAPMSGLHFNKVAVIGVGLIGGSLSLKLKEKKLCNTIVGLGRTIENLKAAKRLKIIDSYATDVKEAVKDADLTVVATPVLSISRIIKAAMPYLKNGSIVTDVGSVKQAIVKEVEPIVKEGVFFVAGHPIAGTENAGALAAFSTLFVNRRCILTPTENTDKTALGKIKKMWELAGSDVVEMPAKTHDEILAAVSHLPHIIAYTLVNTVLDMEGRVGPGGVIKYSAGGFKDFTRIAASSPEMWRDICAMNKDAILKMIGKFEAALKRLKTSIEKKDLDEIHKDFEKAKRARQGLK